MTPEKVGEMLSTIEKAINDLEGVRLDQATVAAQMLQGHAVLALGAGLVLVAEEIHNLRIALTEQ